MALWLITDGYMLQRWLLVGRLLLADGGRHAAFTYIHTHRPRWRPDSCRWR